MSQVGHRREGAVVSLGFSSDGEYLVTSGDDYTVRLWDFATGWQLRIFRERFRVARTVAITPDNRHIIMTAGSGRITARSLSTGDLVESYRPDQDGQPRKAWACSPVLPHQAPAGGGCAVCVVDTRAENSTKCLGREDRPISSAVVSPDGRFVVAGSHDNTARLWEMESGAELRRFRGHTDSVLSVAISPDGKRLATGSRDQSARVWDLATGRIERTLGWDGGEVTAVAFSPDGEYLVTGGEDGSVRSWDMETGLQARSFGERAESLRVAEITDHGTLLITVGDDMVRVWDTVSGRQTQSLGIPGSRIASFSVSQDHRFVATGHQGKAVCVWDFKTGRRILRAEGGTLDPPAALAFSPDNRHFAAEGPDGTAKIWSLPSGEPFASIAGVGFMTKAWLSQGARHLFAVNGSTSVLWDVRASKLLRSSPASSHTTLMSPDETWVVANGTLTVTGFGNDGQLTADWRNSPGRVHLAPGEHLMQISREGNHLLTVRDGIANLWDLFAGTRIRSFSSPDLYALSAKFVNDQKYVMAETIGGTAVIWDVESTREVCRLVPGGGAEWAVVTPEGLFDGTAEALRTGLRWSLGTRSYPVATFSEDFHVPGLLARILSGEHISSDGMPELSKDISPPPLVSILAPGNDSIIRQGSVDITVSATNQGGGIDEVRLYHEGKLVGRSKLAAVRLEAGRGVWNFPVRLISGRNRFQAAVLGRDHVQGFSDEVSITHEGVADPATLHLLVVGVSHYKKAVWNLNHAALDAKSISQLLERSQRRLYRTMERDEIYDGSATKRAIMSAFQRLGASAPQDTAIIFLAGRTLASKDLWHFLPHGVEHPERSEGLEDEAVSLAELMDLLAGIGARKVLLLVDSSPLDATPDSMAFRGLGERKALAWLSRATGVHILAVTQTKFLGSERESPAHGSLVGVAREALTGLADGNPKDGLVTARELLSYAEARLPELAQEHGLQPQFPVVDSRGMDFPVGEVE